MAARRRTKPQSWRSGLEESVAASLEARGACFQYESVKLEFEQPAKARKYTPDFVIATKSGKTIYVETKGLWTREDRQKLQDVLRSNPAIDLRLVFQRPQSKLYKGAKTTYAQWCERELGCQWAKGDVPNEWLEE